mgnify:CR=1 FL=1
MPEVAGLTGTPTTPPGYRVITRSAGDEYHTLLRRVDNDEHDPEDKVYRPTERYLVDDDGEKDELELKATEAVVDELEDRGVTVVEEAE